MPHGRPRIRRSKTWLRKAPTALARRVPMGYGTWLEYAVKNFDSAEPYVIEVDGLRYQVDGVLPRAAREELALEWSLLEELLETMGEPPFPVSAGVRRFLEACRKKNPLVGPRRWGKTAAVKSTAS